MGFISQWNCCRAFPLGNPSVLLGLLLCWDTHLLWQDPASAKGVRHLSCNLWIKSLFCMVSPIKPPPCATGMTSANSLKSEHLYDVRRRLYIIYKRGMGCVCLSLYIYVYTHTYNVLKKFCEKAAVYDEFLLFFNKIKCSSKGTCLVPKRQFAH